MPGTVNTALGNLALASNTTGAGNTAVGASALAFNATGSGNIAIGFIAGRDVTGSNNIHIGNIGTLGDNGTIRIGSTAPGGTFIAGIFGAGVSGGAQQVEVNEFGQLGTRVSSRRVKDDIRDMDEASGRLIRLRPVTFRYKAEPVTGSRPLEYGLIAEEVAEIYPELVVRDTDGQPAGVRYHILPALLLNELQRQQRLIEAQQRELDALRSQAQLIDELAARLSRLEAKGAAAATQWHP